jgi:5'-deoxynucleotidase YfbR-like HD superfamily hydrolase
VRSDNVRIDMRLAGRVLRYHTWPHLRQQSIGEHSWQLLRIVLCVAGDDLRAEVMRHIVTHDVGEHACGDIPYPVKKNNPDLKTIMDGLEHSALQEMSEYWGMPPSPDLSPEERFLVKVCEMIEMAEWGLEEVASGNRQAALVSRRCLEAAGAMIHSPETLLSIEEVARAESYMKKRVALHTSSMETVEY